MRGSQSKQDRGTARVQKGRPHPLGATPDGTGVNFALFSAHATRVEVCLFDEDGTHETARISLPEQTDEVWHGHIPSVRSGQLYGYRVHGPWAPLEGHRFNPNKLLLDPYARSLRGSLIWNDALYGYTIGSPEADLTLDQRDSAPFMPKCVVVETATRWRPSFTWRREGRPGIPWPDTIIYEAHVKGVTATHPAVPNRYRGTFSGLANPAIIEHLVRLGITAVELMPIHAFCDDRYLVEKQLTNYWGYSTLAFFAPDQRYISRDGDFNQFKLMVDRLHAAGIEVLLDVVYNHTAEGNHLGPTLSFRGIDNCSYYTMADEPRFYFDTTGCGNTLNLGHPRVLQMVMDSLRYWVEEGHVDGFRFDLATTLARHDRHFDPSSNFLSSVRQDPVLSQVKLISESWDLGADGYQVGNFPPGWAEWNGRYRDDLRSYWKGDEGSLPGIASGILGSSNLFDKRGRQPWASINFITAHDGFTLADLYAFNEKHNEANGENGNDGHDDNRSWNCGAEGPTDNPEIVALRERMRRGALTILMLSQGTPMLLMGDEVGRTQMGNNNAYCQDNTLSWMHWDSMNEADELFFEYVAGLVRIRKQRPLLRRDRFLHGERVTREGVRNVTWLRPDGRQMTKTDWRNGHARAVGLVLAQTGAMPLFIVMNAHHDDLPFQLTAPHAVSGWRLLIDSAGGLIEPAGPLLTSGSATTLPGRGVLLYEGQRK
ncbi:MAG: glycogen debranching protein GlgX [Hyphomicrobiaceae bacterium]